MHAAGSLRAAFTRLGAHFEDLHQHPLTQNFGAAGLLKDRLIDGEPSSLFASANLLHPQALVAAGRSRSVQVFARNRLCLLATSRFAGSTLPLPQRLLDPAMRIGTSTPGADPSGEYAWQLFDRIEASGLAPPGAAAALKAKALPLTGAGDKPAAASPRSLYGQLLAQGAADVFITYRTNGIQACADFPELSMLELANACAVEASYGMAVLETEPAGGQAFADLLLSAPGQAILRVHGFETP